MEYSTMTANLPPSTIPISLDANYITTTPRTLGLRCHDRHFRDAIVCDESGDKLFDFTAKNIGTSWTLRRSLVDSNSGKHILDLRHTKMSLNSWIIENNAGIEICKIKDVTTLSRFTAVEVQCLANNNSDTAIQMKSFDKAGSRTSFLVDGVVIAEMTLTDNNDASFLHKRGLDRTNWTLEVQEGVDVALVVGLAFARAEISHAWRR
jgi:hypothetical protein